MGFETAIDYFRHMKYWPASLLVLLSLTTFAQDKSYNISRINGEIKIDGKLDEVGWSNLPVATDFHQYFPNDTSMANSQVEIKMAYDDQFLYIGAKMYNLDDDRTYAVPSLRRDYRGNFDGITIEIDPFLDNTNAFQFGINPYGVQREGLIRNGGSRGNDLALAWDNKWLADADMNEGYWTAEAAIPFKTLRFKPGSSKWNINFYRIDSEEGERSTWAHIPRNFHILSLAFMNQIVWEEPLESGGSNISIIPYISAGTNRNYEGENSIDNNLNFGGDAKIGIGPSLNLDLTVNPDFSQVEVDEQVTNLNRFELFFPERRQFFLENADLFESFGHPFFARPFFSRRIGVARDESTGQNIQNTIYGGARLSGKLDNNWRIGLMTMQTAEDDAINLPSINYSVGAIQRKVFGRSNIGVMVVNKQAANESDYLVNDTTAYKGFNRLIGMDYNIASSDGKWVGKVNYHHSFDELTEKDNASHTFWLSNNGRRWFWSWAHVYVGENHNAEVGFVPRPGMFRINPDFGLNFFPKGSIFNNISIQGEVEMFWNKERKTDQKIALNFNSGLRNTGRLSFSLERNYTWLFSDFNVTRKHDEVLPAETDYTYHSLNFRFMSDSRKPFNYAIDGYVGEYFNANRIQVGSEINYRFQPILAVRLRAQYNRINLPDPYQDADLWLVGPRIDLTISKSIFFTNFVQYNSQIDNININSRFQWRFAPVSDLFIVYTDNYGTQGLSDIGLLKKNRALVLKLTYWLNL